VRSEPDLSETTSGEFPTVPECTRHSLFWGHGSTAPGTVPRSRCASGLGLWVDRARLGGGLGARPGSGPGAAGRGTVPFRNHAWFCMCAVPGCTLALLLCALYMYCTVVLHDPEMSID
jgi:hypothetical protein